MSGAALDELTRQDLARCARRLGATQVEALLERGELARAAAELLSIARKQAAPLGTDFWETLSDAFAGLRQADYAARCFGHMLEERTGFVDVEVVWAAPVRMGACTFWKVGEEPELATAQTYVDSEHATRLVPDEWCEWSAAHAGSVIEAQDPSTGERIASGTVRAVLRKAPSDPPAPRPTPAAPAPARPPAEDGLRFYQGDAIREAWSQASARPLARGPALDAYVGALEHHYRQVAAGCFELALDPQVFAMAAHVENWKYARPVEHLFAVPGVALHPDLQSVREVDREYFDGCDLFDLAACLGQALSFGGAYSSPSSRSASLRLGAACAEEILGDHDGLALVSRRAWCKFLFDIAWDLTVVVIVPAERRVTVLAGSDTD